MKTVGVEIVVKPKARWEAGLKVKAKDGLMLKEIWQVS